MPKILLILIFLFVACFPNNDKPPLPKENQISLDQTAIFENKEEITPKIVKIIKKKSKLETTKPYFSNYLKLGFYIKNRIRLSEGYNFT